MSDEASRAARLNRQAFLAKVTLPIGRLWLANGMALAMAKQAQNPRHARDQHVTWLHLSDLHACSANRGWDSRRVLGSLKSDILLMERDQGLHPDMIMFTGDLAYGHLGDGAGLSLDDQYGEVSGFLNDIRTTFSPKVPKKRVFIVPGNHDVKWQEVGPEQNEYLDSSGRQVDEIHEMMNANSRTWQRFMERLSCFRQFLKRERYGHLLTRPQWLISAHALEIRGLVVGIACLNSVWSCGETRGKGRLWLGGHWQVGQLDSELNHADIRIALLHHPAGWYVQQEDGMWLRHIQNPFAFCLHGHEHDLVVEHISNRQHIRIAAGACYERSDRLLGYNFVRLLLTERRAEVWCRRYDNRGGGWGPDVVPGVTDAAGVVNLPELVLPDKLQGRALCPRTPVPAEDAATSSISRSAVQATVASAKAEVVAAGQEGRVSDAAFRLEVSVERIEKLSNDGELDRAFAVAGELRDWLESHGGLLQREQTARAYALLAKAWGNKAATTEESAARQTLLNEARSFLEMARNA